MAEKSKGITSYTYHEARTANGQLLSIACEPDGIEKIEAALAHIRSVEVPTARKINNITHGGYGRYTRFDITQHKYAGGGAGYIEAFEILGAPDERCNTLIHEYSSYEGSVFFEFDSLKNTIAAWEKLWGHGRNIKKEMRDQPGYIRTVVCGWLSPWFYAVGDQEITGDYVFPDVLGEEDGQFQAFTRWVIRDYEGLPSIKTCVGVGRVMKTVHTGGLYTSKQEERRRVFWDDGTFWTEGDRPAPTKLLERDLWIQEAIDKFRLLLAGGTKRFEILFLDGSKFIGRWQPQGAKSHHAEGTYKASILVEGEDKERTGTVRFTPSEETPTIESALRWMAKEKGKTIEKIVSVVMMKGTHTARKWLGVFSPPSNE